MQPPADQRSRQPSLSTEPVSSNVSEPQPPGAREYALERTRGAEGAKRRNNLVFATTLRQCNVDFNQYELLLNRLETP